MKAYLPTLHVHIVFTVLRLSVTFRTPFSHFFFFLFLHNCLTLISTHSPAGFSHRIRTQKGFSNKAISSQRTWLNGRLLPSHRRRHVMPSIVLPKGPLERRPSLFCLLNGTRKEFLGVQSNTGWGKKAAVCAASSRINIWHIHNNRG